MLSRIKGNLLFKRLLKRPDITKAYAMVKPSDSWYETIMKVHNSLDEILQLPHEVVSITSHDGLKLKGIYYPAKTNSLTTIICVHGYTSHAEREWAFPGLFYHSLGYNVLIPYQRAHGISQGKYISFGALEHLDVINWAKKINMMIPSGNIVIHGLSMGGGIVMDLSSTEIENVRCLIADAPNLSIEKFFNNVSKEFFKKDADKIVKFAMERFKKEFNVDASLFDGIEISKECKYPLLLAAGSNEHLEDKFDEIKKNNPKETQVVILPGCDHGNGMYKQTELFQNAIKKFINKNI